MPKKTRLVWKDESTRSQDRKAPTAPTIWRLRLGSSRRDAGLIPWVSPALDITVHRHIDTGDTVWYLSVRQLSELDRVALKSKGHIEAKDEAIRRVFTYLTSLLVVATKAHADVTYDHEGP